MAEATTRGARAPRRHGFWLLVDGDGSICTVGRGGAPAVFSGEGEAEIFRLFGAREAARWRARPTPSGELVSVLYCRCAAAKKVCLDPTPEMLCAGMAGLVTMDKERFVERVVGLRGSSAPVASPHGPVLAPVGVRSR